MNKKIYAALMCLVLALTTAVPASAANKPVKLSKTKITLGVKQTYTLKLSNNKKKVSWSSNKKSVAAVTSKGKVTAKKKGTATITAKVGKKKYNCKVTVKNPVLSKKKLSMDVNDSCMLKLKYNSFKIKWSSSDKSVAAVTSKGKVTAKKEGTTTITAKVGNKKYNCKVTVKQMKEEAPVDPGVCTHDWLDITKEVVHPAETHEEPVYETKQVLVTPAWDEEVYVKTMIVCAGGDFETSDVHAMTDHLVETGHSCSSYDVFETVHHDAVYETQKLQTGTKTVVDKEAWTETVVIGKKCTKCGETKDLTE